jgi:hypothetical protein
MLAPSQPSAAAARKRAYKARQKIGQAVFRVTADEDRLAEALIASGRISEDAAVDRAKIEAALSQVVADWVERWQTEGRRVA